jgi:hypothetical protein
MVYRKNKKRIIIDLNFVTRPFDLAKCFFCLLAGLHFSALTMAAFDYSYTPVQNGGAEEGLLGWSIEGSASVDSGGVKGDKCFKLSASPEQSCTLTSKPLSIRRGEKLQLKFQLKSGVAEVVPDTAVTVRFYGSDGKSILSQSGFIVKPTGRSWIEQSYELTADAMAYSCDIQFSTTLLPEGTVVSVFVDEISLFREIKYTPMYADIKPLSQNDTLYVFTKGPRSEDNQFVAMQTLQGIVARTSRPRLWIDAGDATFVDEFQQKYKIQFDWSLSRDCAGLLEALKPYTSGSYVLYDRRDNPSLSAAATLSGLLDAVAVDMELEPAAIAKGYTKAFDARGKDCRWVYENYRQKINDNLIIVHTNNRRFHPSAYHMKDWAAATRALSWWYEDESFSRVVYRSMAPCSPVYGWLDAATRDEGLSVKLHSQEGLFQVPSDWMLNLSVHASMGQALKDKKFTQKVTRPSPVKETGIHYVTFILSDMDNILTEIGTNSFYSQKKFYRNPHRGEYAMTWGMAPSLVELAPHAVDMWYRDATAKDAFIAYCGLGYSYPNSSPYLQTHAQRLGELMKRADLRVLLLIDYLLPDKLLTDHYYQTAKWFTALDEVRGLFYLEYIQYAPHGGKIFWFDGKPMVTPRFDFRQETFYPAVRPTPVALAQSINSLPKDPASPDGYTAVTVHAWSRGLDDIAETIQQLDPDVRVVQAEEFIELIRRNLKDTNTR